MKRFMIILFSNLGESEFFPERYELKWLHRVDKVTPLWIKCSKSNSVGLLELLSSLKEPEK